MSELERFRDYARTMASSEHAATCAKVVPGRWNWDVRTVWPNPDCTGCISDSDRALWATLASEVDAYLGDDAEPLWENADV